MVDPTQSAELPPTRREALDATPSAPSADQATTPDAAMPARPRAAGQQFGKYDLLEQVARGGMGVVYRARDTVLGRVVALKMIRSGVLAQPEEVQRFYREAQAAAQLSHPNIVPILEVGEHDGQHYFTMVFAPGGSLAQERDRGPADPRAAVARAEKVARAVQYAHDRGILHRDLKPANILLDEHGEPLVSDFGLAKFLDSDVELTHSGQVLGTPAYMAPEQASGHSASVSRQTDVWSLGVLLYELLTGRRPFVGEGRDELWQHIRTADPASPRSCRPELDRALETVLLKCLEKDPARRYGSAGELADDLARWLRGEPVRVRPQPWPARVWRAARRRSRLWAPVALLVLTAAGISLFLYFNDPDRALRSAQARLAKGQPLTLVAATGPPGWSAAPYRQATYKLSTAANEPLTVYAWDPCLLELLRDPQHPHFRFRAEVRYDNGDERNYEAGIFVAYSEHGPDQAQRRYHCFVLLGFNPPSPDPAAPVAREPGGRRVQACLDLGCFRDPQPFYWTSNCTRQQFPLPDGQPTNSVWHTLGLEVSPDSFRAVWDGQPLGAVSGASLALRTNVLAHPTNPNAPSLPFEPAFRPRQPLGLYVRGGAASFRNVVVEPLPDGQ